MSKAASTPKTSGNLAARNPIEIHRTARPLHALDSFRRSSKSRNRGRDCPISWRKKNLLHWKVFRNDLYAMKVTSQTSSYATSQGNAHSMPGKLQLGRSRQVFMITIDIVEYFVFLYLFLLLSLATPGEFVSCFTGASSNRFRPPRCLLGSRADLGSRNQRSFFVGYDFENSVEILLGKRRCASFAVQTKRFRDQVSFIISGLETQLVESPLFWTKGVSNRLSSN